MTFRVKLPNDGIAPKNGYMEYTKMEDGSYKYRMVTATCGSTTIPSFIKEKLLISRVKNCGYSLKELRNFCRQLDLEIIDASARGLTKEMVAHTLTDWLARIIVNATEAVICEDCCQMPSCCKS